MNLQISPIHFVSIVTSFCLLSLHQLNDKFIIHAEEMSVCLVHVWHLIKMCSKHRDEQRSQVVSSPLDGIVNFMYSGNHVYRAA